MKYEKGKFFRKLNTQDKRISCISMDEAIEYYTFIKKYYEQDYRQIIITSEMMIKLIETSIVDFNYSIYEIEFVEDDEYLNTEVSDILNKLCDNKAYIHKLISYLQFLSEKSSIDIQRVYFKGRTEQGLAVKFFIQSNGIIGIDENNFSMVSQQVSSLIERYMF